MSDLSPSAILRVFNSDTEFFGRVVAPPQSLSYDLPGLIGTPGAFFAGFQKDLTGRYLCQQIVPVPVDIDPSKWTGTTAADTFGTDASTGKKIFFHSSATGAFSVAMAAARMQDEGIAVPLFIGAAAPNVSATFYVEFSRGRVTGETGLRVAFEPGSTIRLQASYDNDVTWTDVDSANALGECEAYLDSKGRLCNITVLSMCDSSWAAGLPGSLALSGPPPNVVTVSIGSGDAVLQFPTDRLSAGRLAVTGTSRQWSLRSALLRHAITGGATLAPQVRPEPLQTTPYASLSGYVPYGGGVSGQVIVDTGTSAHVQMTLSAPGDTALSPPTGVTGYATRTCYLSSVDAEFPPLQIPPLPAPASVDYYPIYSEVRHSWDQTSGTYRHVAYLLFDNNQDQFAPGVLVQQSAKAARLYHAIDPAAGASDFPPGSILEVINGQLYAMEMTGWTAMEEDGQGWYYEGGLKYFRVTLSDRMVHTEADTAISCGYQLPYDYQCQYYAFAQQVYRLGIGDWAFNFPLVLRNQSTPYYYLDGGTTLRPVHLFPPDMDIGAAMEHIRSIGAAYDPVSGQPQPMVMGTEVDGTMSFYGMPVGIISCLMDPTQTIASSGLSIGKTYSKVPQFTASGTAALNEFLQTWSSKSSLRRVRTPVVLCGLDPRLGKPIFGAAYNEYVGGGPYSDPNVPGYIGINKPLYVVSRLISSQAVADLSAQKAAVVLAAPAVDTGGKLHLQPGLDSRMIIGVQDYTTQGTGSAVGYYTTHVTGIVDLRDPRNHKGETLISARILGMAS